MVKIWLRTAESGSTCFDNSGFTDVVGISGDAVDANDEYPDADGVAVNGPIISIVRRGQIKVLSTDGRAGEQQQVHTLAMYPIGVVRKIVIDD